jgi:hypothetical protein
MKKILFIISILATTFMACHKHDDTTPYVITFDVKNANGTADLSGAVGKEMTFDVTFTHASNSTVHNVKVAVLDVNNKEIKVLEEKHAHSTATYNTKLKYTPLVAGNFKLKAAATDDNEGQPNEKTFEFVVK